MIAHATETRSTLLSDLALALALATAFAVFIAGMCVALAWMAPLELVPPRTR